MFYLIPAILFSSAIGVVFKLAEKRVESRINMLLANYVVAVLISGLMWLSSGSSATVSVVSFVLAFITGLIFAGNFFIMLAAVRARGVALPVILMRLSAVVPVGASILFFAERPDLPQYLGLAGAIAAAALLSVSVKGGELQRSGAKAGWSLIPASLGMLFCFGAADLFLKLFDEFGPPAEKPIFLLLLFASALAVFIVAALKQRCRLYAKDLLWGGAIGVPNMLASWFIVSALSELPAHVVFPVVSAGNVLLISLVAVLVFRERISAWGVFAVFLTLASIIAINAG